MMLPCMRRNNAALLITPGNLVFIGECKEVGNLSGLSRFERLPHVAKDFIWILCHRHFLSKDSFKDRLNLPEEAALSGK